jgi:hypothetical protein
VWILCDPTFRKNVSSPSSGYKNPRARDYREQVAAAGFSLANFSTLKMEVIRSSETFFIVTAVKTSDLTYVLTVVQIYVGKAEQHIFVDPRRSICVYERESINEMN